MLGCILTILSLFLWDIINAQGQRTCLESQSCLDKNFGVNYTYIKCDGFESCKGLTDTTASVGMACYGSKSCTNIDSPYLRAATVDCWGYESCMESKIIADGNTNCYGEKSCFKSDIVIASDTVDQEVASHVVECNGLLSCALSTFTLTLSDDDATSSFLGYDTFAFYDSVINSSESALNLELYGYYAGYNATVICGARNKNCTVQCYGNACFNTLVICLDDAYCKIYCNETAGISCPLNVTYSSSDRVNDYSAAYTNNHNVSVSLKYFSLNDTDNICLDISQSVTLFDYCNDYQECYNATYIDNNNKSVCCQATESCLQATIRTSSWAYQNSDNYVNAIIRCDGGSSCQDTTVVGNNSVVCGGFYSCQAAQLDTADMVHCNGFSSCVSATIDKATQLFCNSYGSCYNSVVNGVANVYAFGYRAFDGENSLISSGQTGMTMNVYFCGYQSGYDVSICCFKEDTCNVYCASDDACTNIAASPSSGCDGNFTVHYNSTISADVCQIYQPVPTLPTMPNSTNFTMDFNSTGGMSSTSSTTMGNDTTDNNNTGMFSTTMASWSNLNMTGIESSMVAGETTGGGSAGGDSNKNENSTLGTVAIVVASLVGVAIIGLGVFWWVRRHNIKSGVSEEQTYKLLDKDRL